MFEPQPPPLLRTVLTRSLERDARRRYPHAGALANELRRAAMSMGVGDGRGFLRSALARAFGVDGGLDDEETTGELQPPPPPRPSGVIDRFARLRGDAPPEAPAGPSGLDSGTQLVSSVALDDDCDDAEEA
jgi:hypothetical protein